MWTFSEHQGTCAALRGKWGASATASHLSPRVWLWSFMAACDNLGCSNQLRPSKNMFEKNDKTVFLLLKITIIKIFTHTARLVLQSPKV
jgi:hypothetical protein